MVRKLKSHLRNKKGFTLIELLIVIAIIAILVLIVIVAINPAERLRDAADRRAQSNVRSAGTLLETCITKELSEIPSGTVEGCAVDTGSNGYDQYGSIPTSVVVDPGAGTEDVCASQQGSSERWYRYMHSTGTTDVGTPSATMPGTPGGRCP